MYSIRVGHKALCLAVLLTFLALFLLTYTPQRRLNYDFTTTNPIVPESVPVTLLTELDVSGPGSEGAQNATLGVSSAGISFSKACH